MSRFRRCPPDGTLPSRPGLRPSLYKGRCACGCFIKIGQPVSIDKLTGSLLCADCYRRDSELSRQGLVAVHDSSEAQIKIDRVRRIMTLPGEKSPALQAELGSLLTELKTSFIEDRAVQNFLFRKAVCKRTGRNLYAFKCEYTAVCTDCATELKPETTVVWDPPTRRIWCVNCILAGMSN